MLEHLLNLSIYKLLSQKAHSIFYQKDILSKWSLLTGILNDRYNFSNVVGDAIDWHAGNLAPISYIC